MKAHTMLVLVSIFIATIGLGCSSPRPNTDGSKNYSYHYPPEPCVTGMLPQESKNDQVIYRNKKISEIVGSTHTRSNYYFGDKDSLNEGADKLLEMGTKVVKVWFYNPTEMPDTMYRWNSQWPKADSFVEGAKLPYWKTFFHKPFSTYIMNVMSLHMPEYYWVDGISEQQMAEEKRQFYELTKYFLTEYQNTGKTFIFANHEGDWHLKLRPNEVSATPLPKLETPQERFGYMIKWLQARQDGVEQARKEVGMHGVRVFHAAEVVNVEKTIKEGQDNMVNKVLPFVKVDLVSYSCYDATIYGDYVHDKKDLQEALDYIAEKAIDSEYFGSKNVYIGEYGAPENKFSPQDVINAARNVVEVGLEWGCPYIVYWQLYCNEPKPGVALPDWNNNNHNGFWLIRADGSKTPVYDYFKALLQTEK